MSILPNNQFPAHLLFSWTWAEVQVQDSLQIWLFV
jgi:hypothetical protein